MLRIHHFLQWKKESVEIIPYRIFINLELPYSVIHFFMDRLAARGGIVCLYMFVFRKLKRTLKIANNFSSF